ncbi:hypothetical protein JHN55_05335 [Streptomyces sp. MBT56]|uniref:hypothetical protein n=1 Tax=unclassified Streptomyces TaxID=2593676 RepID=UPI00190ACF3F|nr:MULTISPECIES: hypothetical protein [unclassified Streptomyces]MBK3555970.1 hypothetical protein [Streptomyces sp. MBT56]MBK3605774.1 hypothetical protein [Streptomyces sp. MBT54]MBK3618298.1 hypothetical protein [Streptomyces sp. MBT98]
MSRRPSPARSFSPVGAIRDDYKDQWNHLVSTLLSSDMHWSCYRPREGGLLVSESPVCLSGVVGPPPEDVPPGFFDHGVGIG